MQDQPRECRQAPEPFRVRPELPVSRRCRSRPNCHTMSGGRHRASGRRVDAVIGLPVADFGFMCARRVVRRRTRCPPDVYNTTQCMGSTGPGGGLHQRGTAAVRR
jgi:hypothetical protein